MDKKILITGATGFVGNYLVRELLKTNANISGTYHSSNSLKSFSDISSKLNLIQLDFMDSVAVKKAIEETKPDEIYHLAAVSSSARSFTEPSLVLNNNIVSEVNLLEAVKEAKINPRIMVVSSAEIYGNVAPENLPIDENTPLMPNNSYAVSKIAQDYLGLQYFNSYKQQIIRVRPFNHIGPGQTEEFSTSIFAKKIAEIEKGKMGPVLTVGNLDSKRDFTDVRDMVCAYILLMKKGMPGDVYNIGSGKSHKMSDVLNMLLSFSNLQIKIETDPKLLRPSDNPDLVCDNRKMRELTGWEIQIPLEKTLKDILEYWRGKV